MNLVDLPGVKQNSLGEGGLAGVDVGRDSDVPKLVHGVLPPWLLVLLGAREVAGGELAEVEGADEEGRRCRWGRGRRRRRRSRSVEGVKEAWRGGWREARHGCGGLWFYGLWGV